MSKGLTLTIIFNALSLNYGETTGNISELKKFSRDNGQVFTFASRQALRYDIVRLGNKYFEWQLAPVDKSQRTVQFSPDASIENLPEIDLFGYMKTEKGKGSLTRAAVVRLSPAISLESYLNDIEFLSNKGLADRINEDPNIAQIEQHYSFYTYTITVDLDRVGIDEDIVLPNSERAKRVKDFLSIIKILNREIKGRIENLNPLFVIGGVYSVKNPFFLGKIKLEWRNSKPCICIEPIKDTLNITFMNNVKVAENTLLGFVSGIWGNEEELKQLPVKSVGDIDTIFKLLCTEIDEYYGTVKN
ncbi:type I-B CRISPR-associated protein Cas7/Cst2/DevR [Thermodesulfovibrio hydrogeniphilus]